MARDRFSDLERIYDALKLGNVDINSLPSNLDFVKYGKWKEGETTRETIIRPDLLGTTQVGVIAFGINDTDAAAKIQIGLNTRSYNYWNGLVDKAKFGIATTLTDYNENRSFVPALVRLGVKGGNTVETSDITGRKYKKKTTASYSIPLGQTGTVKFFQEAIQGLLDSALKNTHYISVSPEQFRRD